MHLFWRSPTILKFNLRLRQAADNLPLYGVCCYMEEMVHRPPAILSDVWPQCSTPLSRYLIAAPRCYCLLTHFPFFTLHMKVGTPARPLIPHVRSRCGRSTCHCEGLATVAVKHPEMPEPSVTSKDKRYVTTCSSRTSLP